MADAPTLVEMRRALLASLAVLALAPAAHAERTAERTAERALAAPLVSKPPHQPAPYIDPRLPGRARYVFGKVERRLYRLRVHGNVASYGIHKCGQRACRVLVQYKIPEVLDMMAKEMCVVARGRVACRELWIQMYGL